MFFSPFHSHVGDLGNLKSDCFGVVNTALTDHLISLVGPNSVIGRAFVVGSSDKDHSTYCAFK